MNNGIELKIFAYKSEDYDRQVALRSAVLRAPLGLKFSVADLKNDEDNILFGAFIENEIVGCCQFKILNDKKVQLRQMAVNPAIQGKKIGSQLIEFAESYATSNNYSVIELHARKVAMEFYKKLGYNIVGEEFFEVGIPHFYMEKEL